MVKDSSECWATAGTKLYNGEINSAFDKIPQGLMQNRNLSPRIVSRSAALSESTVNQLLNGSLAPDLKILHGIAPVLQIPVSDLLVIANVQGESNPTYRQAYPAAQEMGRLIALSSFLPSEHVQQLVERAQDLKEQALRDQE